MNALPLKKMELRVMKNLRSYRYNTGAILIVAGMFGLLVNQSLAATTGNITISGVVSAATAIVVNSVAGYNSLDLSTTASDQAVANVREINNTTNGYTVTLTSQNSGLLKNGTLGSVSYSAKYNGSSVSLSSTPVTITNGAASNSVVNVVKSFQISYTGTAASNLMVGTYSDTLTFTIAAN